MRSIIQILTQKLMSVTDMFGNFVLFVWEKKINKYIALLCSKVLDDESLR